MRAFKKLLLRARPRVVLTRNKLCDGYSDDVLATLASAGSPAAVRVAVLLGPAASSAQQARQLALGADSVHRDPVRTDVLIEYLAKYRARARRAAPKPKSSARGKPFRLAGAAIRPLERVLQHGNRCVRLTPREVQLAELLSESRGEVVTYQTLYSEILGARFRGETSNMRVLLGKLDASFRSVGLGLRKHVEVIPKTGYRYRRPRPLRLATARETVHTAAA